MGLKNHTAQAEAAFGSFGTAALLFTIPSAAGPPAQATFKNLSTTGNWYIQFQRNVIGSGPTTTVYSRKLVPGEEFTEDNPPSGDVWALVDGTTNGNMSYYASWTQ